MRRDTDRTALTMEDAARSVKTARNHREKAVQGVGGREHRRHEHSCGATAASGGEPQAGNA